MATELNGYRNNPYNTDIICLARNWWTSLSCEQVTDDFDRKKVAEALVDYLNGLMEIDKDAVSKLFMFHTPCCGEIDKFVIFEMGRYVMLSAAQRFLCVQTLLNGFLGAYGKTDWFIYADVQGEELLGFVLKEKDDMLRGVE